MKLSKQVRIIAVLAIILSLTLVLAQNLEKHSVSVTGLDLNYYESSGTGQNIFLVHGNSASGLTFSKQLNGELGKKYHIIAIDLPGHGDSSAFMDSTNYSLPGYAKAISEAAKKLTMEDAYFVGWSLGGHIVLEAVAMLPKAKGFVIYGTPPLGIPADFATAFLPNPAMAAAFNPELSDAEAVAFADAFFAPGSMEDVSPFFSDIMKTDGNARANLGASINPDGYTDEIEIVANMTQPLMIIHGVKEQLVNGAYFRKLEMPTLWNNRVEFVWNAGHAVHWETADEFSALLDEFISDTK